MSVTKSWQTEVSATVKQVAKADRLRICFYKGGGNGEEEGCQTSANSGGTPTTTCGHWSRKDSGTAQKWPGETYRYFGTGETGTCHGPK
jgi:hypothetical protein